MFFRNRITRRMLFDLSLVFFIVVNMATATNTKADALRDMSALKSMQAENSGEKNNPAETAKQILEALGSKTESARGCHYALQLQHAGLNIEYRYSFFMPDIESISVQAGTGIHLIIMNDERADNSLDSYSFIEDNLELVPINVSMLNNEMDNLYMRFLILLENTFATELENLLNSKKTTETETVNKIRKIILDIGEKLERGADGS